MFFAELQLSLAPANNVKRTGERRSWTDRLGMPLRENAVLTKTPPGVLRHCFETVTDNLTDRALIHISHEYFTQFDSSNLILAIFESEIEPGGAQIPLVGLRIRGSVTKICQVNSRPAAVL